MPCQNLHVMLIQKFNGIIDLNQKNIENLIRTFRDIPGEKILYKFVKKIQLLT